MAKDRKSARMKTQIKSLLSQGLSIRKVAAALNVSRQTVRKFNTEEASELETAVSGSVVDWDGAVDWTEVANAVTGGTTVKQLHAEYAPGVSYTRFRRRLRVKRPPPPAVTIRLEHKPGERTQIDYCDGIATVDRATGEVKKTHLFCGVLPFSSYAFGEFVSNQKLASFIESHERMWAYFGGVTPYVVIDNLKAGVKAAHRYDPDINPTYCDYGNHQGFAVLPARPYTPRDKACVEATIGAIQRSFYQEVRGRTFYSLEELNRAFRIFLDGFNRQLMKDHGQSRLERFAAECSLLQPLPVQRFELCEWKSAKVHPDCHIQVAKNLYSVPHRLVGQTIRVRLGSKLVEAFVDGESVATHPRQKGAGNVVTNEQHYPDGKREAQSFHVQSALAEARVIGPYTEELVVALTTCTHPLRYLRRVQGILRVYRTDGVTLEAAEYASKMALGFKRLRVDYVKGCVEHFIAHGARPSAVMPRRSEGELFLHGHSQSTLGGDS
jgi:transposase